jgi:putative phage-type endonuclease
VTAVLSTFNATPVTSWEAPDHVWHAARAKGIGASSAATVLGFIKWRTPWQVWAEKTGARRPPDLPSDAAELGNDLEPWLLEQAAKLLGQPVTRTDYRMYAHPQHPWRLASPDGVASRRLVELKTAGLASGWGIPHGWDDDRVPLGYEIQARWQMHVLDVHTVEMVALVAGLGVIRRTVTRDLEVEQDMVTQVTDWWQRFVIGGEEPPFDLADKDTVAFLYPRVVRESIDLDLTDAPSLLARRVGAVQRRKAGKDEVDAIDIQLKALIGDHDVARIGDRDAYSWSEKRGVIDWPRFYAEAVEAGTELPDPELYRKPPTRSLNVKDSQ